MSHPNHTVNPQAARTPQHPGALAKHQLAQLTISIQAGVRHRCPGCLRWVKGGQIIGVALFIPDGAWAQIPYVVCKKCNPAVARKERVMLLRIEANLLGCAK